MMKKAVYFLFVILMVSAPLPSIGGARALLLAPHSEVAVSANQREFEFLLEQNNRLKKQILSSDATVLSDVVVKQIRQMGRFQPVNREQYIALRGALSWWLFFENEVAKVVPDQYKRKILVALNSLEKSFDSLFTEKLQESTLRNPPIWDEKSFSKGIYLEAYDQKETINQWLAEKGRLAKALHIVHGIPITELQKAFELEAVQVRVFSKGFGSFKYVLKVEVQINHKPYYLALKKVYASRQEQSDESVLREISATNMNYQFGLPIIGTSSVKKRIWLDEYILGDDLDKFVLKLAAYGFSPEQILQQWQQLQKEAAKKFILLCVRGFSGLYYVDDPHTGNIMAYWPALQEKQLDPDQLKLNQIRLSLMDVGSLGTTFQYFKNLPVNTAIVDVGRTQAVEESMAAFFRVTYNELFVDSQDKVLALLPALSSLTPPTRLELVKEVLDEFTLDEKVIFISALLQGLPQEMSYVDRLISNSILLKRSNDLAEARAIKNELEKVKEFLLKSISDEIKNLAVELARVHGEPSSNLLERWNYVLALAQKKNDLQRFEMLNRMLEFLVANEVVSLPIRRLAAQSYKTRTGKDLRYKIDISSPRTTLQDISL